MAKTKKNPNGFIKASKTRLKRLLRHLKNHPNDTKNLNKIKDKIKKCESGNYRK